MTIRRLFLLAAAPLAVTTAHASTYGDTLLAATAARHAELVAVAVHVTGKAGPIEVSWGKAPKANVSVPLTDALGKPIGTVAFGFRKSAHDGPKIAAEMARRIYVVDNLAEPDPFVPGAKRLPKAQMLVDKAIDANPDLVTLAMHLTPPSEATNIIAASNFGRIGKAADKDDAQVMNEGITRKEVTNGGTRIAVELPQKDAAGKIIGALSTSFMLQPGQDPSAGEARAIAVRDALAAATPSIEALAKGK